MPSTESGTAPRYPWQEELKQLLDEFKQKGRAREYTHFPGGKIPLSEALAWIEEHAKRPEIMTALSNVGLREWMRDEDDELWREFTKYLRLRRPTAPDISPYVGISARRLACGEYTGSNDPRLISKSLANRFIADDRDAV